MMEKIMEIIKGVSPGVSDGLADKFIKETVEKQWNEYVMNIETIIRERVNALKISIPNASVKKDYVAKIVFDAEGVTNFSVDGLDDSGLTAVIDGKNVLISGTPIKSGTFPLKIKYTYDGCPLTSNLERQVDLIINPDPRDLWKNIPTPEDIEYFKPDEAKEYQKVPSINGVPQKDIVAASKRGRSHAQEGKPRDDDFRLYHSDSNWYVIAVADGAGSAKFSREGSRIACQTVVNHCSSLLDNCVDFENAISYFNQNQDDDTARKQVGDHIWNIVGAAAFKAHKTIDEHAESKGVPSKLYATTLLLAIAKKFDFGWFVATFWVGDGAICLYTEDNNGEQPTAVLLGVPDEGEYAGQTRFLTMPDVFQDSTSLYKRLRFRIVDDFTALLLMTDGVSDPWFETDNNLNNPEKWQKFYKEIQDNNEHPVNLQDDNEEAAQQLLDWLDFWSPGNHDDRTIAILY